MKLVIKYPTRARPELFKQTLGRYRAALSGEHPVTIVITADLDDETMTSPDMRNFLVEEFNRPGNPLVMHRYGTSKSKVEAINANMDLAGDFDIVLLASDDMIPVVPNIDKIIIGDMSRHHPDTDGCLFYPDGLRRDALCTLSILGRKYYDRFGYIYHPSYRSLVCDDEFSWVARAAGKLTYIPQTIIRHFWTAATGTDPLHRRNQIPFAEDQANFQRRREAGFPK